MLNFPEKVEKGIEVVVLFLVGLESFADEIVAIRQCFCNDFVDIIVSQSLPFVKLKREDFIFAASFLPNLV